MPCHPQLLSPLQVAHLTLPNRMVMGAIHTRLETLDNASEKLCAFYSARAQGEIALILTGGHSPTPEGVMEEMASVFNSTAQIPHHQSITSAVHQAGGLIALQILHAGRYAKISTCVAPSAIKARINTFTPRELQTDEIWALIQSYAHTAQLAQNAGYDGIEIMGSEGYLICEFTAPRTNHRTDQFGGSFENRIRFALEITKAIRQSVGTDFLIIYRISAIDLVEDGMTGPQIAQFARHIEAAGANIINTGIGWHESAIPTIASAVPRGAWASAVKNVKQAVTIPVMASNRINTPDIAEEIIASGCADLVSMARPLLADPFFAQKVRLGTLDQISPCIACNQSCLDHIFTNRVATCLVNPKAARETEYNNTPTSTPKHIAVVGAGPAGIAFAINAANRGHKISLFEQNTTLGGQLNLAKIAPGKTEFNELLRYLTVMLQKTNVHVHLGIHVQANHLLSAQFDEIVIATGITPRIPNIPGITHPKVLSYIDVLTSKVQIGKTVAIIGAGGIAYDVASYLLGDNHSSTHIPTFNQIWGIDATISTPGGLTTPHPPVQPLRQIHMLQRKQDPFGRTLGKSTGWIVKAKLQQASVRMISSVNYQAIDHNGLHYTLNNQTHTLSVDHIIVCAGQNANQELYLQLQQLGAKVHLIGGASDATKLDASKAIEQGTRLAATI